MPTNHQIGYAGEAAVASELSFRGYVVSMPTVDLGNDLFVENHNTGKTWRIQVKAARPPRFQFAVREDANHSPTAKADHFVFVLRINDSWCFYVIPQAVLSNYAHNGMGTVSKDRGRTFTFLRDPATGDVTCSGQNMNGHLNAWDSWPVI